jgi:hypothetical protein
LFAAATAAAAANCHIVQADIETTYLEADQGYCTDIRDEYVRHFLGEEFVSGGGN